ncbi:MAG: hypothetical protein ABIQ31_11245 [Ferruginibacter sp.]
MIHNYPAGVGLFVEITLIAVEKRLDPIDSQMTTPYGYYKKQGSFRQQGFMDHANMVTTIGCENPAGTYL